KTKKTESKTQAEQKAEQQALVLKTLQKEAITPKNELFHDRNDAWARIEIDGHCENMPLKGERFRSLLTRRMRDELGYMPKKAHVNDVLNEFSGTALFDGPEYPIALR